MIDKKGGARGREEWGWQSKDKVMCSLGGRVTGVGNKEEKNLFFWGGEGGGEK